MRVQSWGELKNILDSLPKEALDLPIFLEEQYKEKLNFFEGIVVHGFDAGYEISLEIKRLKK